MSEWTTIHTPVIAGNWKMHKGPVATREFFHAFRDAYPPHEDRTIVFFLPAISLTAGIEGLGDRADIDVGVQNIHWEPQGAFTGEISARMAWEAGARYTLVGHSERRHLFGETDEQCALKVRAALDAGLTPVLCVGETLHERRAGRVADVILRQLDAVAGVLPPDRIPRILLAYEPVWAIGTGVNATPEDASEAHGVLRDRLHDLVGDAAAAIPILYGGSVKVDNAAALLRAEGVDGLLVGGASLDPSGFADIAATPVAAA
ncbi:MAG: triose-phosphate isomerase [Gemmatimonadetes bacterium]|nr:triose-phosphate isomerase [Gemmatimonadota bacterium]